MEQSKQPCSIMTILQPERNLTAPRVQEVLTTFGCIIRARLGLHESTVDYCSPQGLIVLIICGQQSEVDGLAGALRAIDSVKVQTMQVEP